MAAPAPVTLTFNIGLGYLVGSPEVPPGAEVFSLDTMRGVYVGVPNVRNVHWEAALLMDLIEVEATDEEIRLRELDPASDLMMALKGVLPLLTDATKSAELWRFESYGLVEALRLHRTAVKAALQKKIVDVVIDNTNTKFDDMRQFIAAGLQVNADMNFRWLKRPPLRECLARNIQRLWEQGKYVPSEIVAAQLANLDALEAQFPGGLTKASAMAELLRLPLARTSGAYRRR